MVLAVMLLGSFTSGSWSICLASLADEIETSDCDKVAPTECCPKERSETLDSDQLYLVEGVECEYCFEISKKHSHLITSSPQKLKLAVSQFKIIHSYNLAWRLEKKSLSTVPNSSQIPIIQLVLATTVILI